MPRRADREPGPLGSRRTRHRRHSTGAAMSDTDTGPIYGPVIGQYFGIFHGCTKEHYRKIVESAPFDHCNLLILGFLRIAETSPPNPVYIPKFTNWRDNQFNGGWSTPD